MEVTGRKESSMSAIFCRPCQRDNETVHAEGYCETCNEHICSSCITAHRKLASTKSHIIKSKEEMPTNQAESDPCTELCDVHVNEIVKFYCQEHDSVGCGDCMVLQHTSCKVQLVSDISSNYENGDDLFGIKHRIDCIQKNIASYEKEIECCLKTAEEIKTNAISDIKRFRKEIEDYLNKMEADLLQKVDEMSASDFTTLRKLPDKCKTLASNIEEFRNKLEKCKDNVDSLFVASKIVKERLYKCQEMNEEISFKSKINAFKFMPSEHINNLKISNECLGNLNTHVKRFAEQCKRPIIGMKTSFLQKLSIEAKYDRDCFIKGMAVISEDEILCADVHNSSLKVLNHRKGKITSTVQLETFPAGVTTITPSSAAATLPIKGKILFLRTQSRLKKSHKISVRKGCQAIDHCDGKIAVTFCEPPSVLVMDTKGQILLDLVDTGLLNSPRYISMSNNNKSMLVSDLDNEAVYEFNLKGELQATNKSVKMGKPAGITVTNCGCAVVCYRGKSEKAGLIVPETRKILPLYLHNVLIPCSILISEEQRKLFISEHETSTDCNVIKMFDYK
ncbi:E3 ubiquitin-protein ligase TRIM71-like [Ruditapes philippinarum]|uniref:E3 ubiquitin-protein ligase TRIM71-like n=1 Tax=Ruditapes philippinarum TaxID=129788 RepID=UPI00295A9380|nr:E3 ubiquitin-protein ligase TRIM71-like [Ruditapes philippinarum]